MDHQPFPTTGRLTSNMNLELAKLRSLISFEQSEVYCYVVATIKNQNGHFFQTGSAPNFQGDLVSLCTCKHFMRTFMDAENWTGKWIAGFSGVAAGNGANAFVYLMKIGCAFKSHMSLWFSDEIPMETKKAKSAQANKYGDIYQPLIQVSDPFATQSYYNPVPNHVHCDNNNWHNDINYEGSKGRKAALLIGDPEYSFLWNQPMIDYQGHLHRGQKKSDFKTFLHEKLEDRRS
jgi:hypothetical protein